jgi:hypothetical protein
MFSYGDVREESFGIWFIRQPRQKGSPWVSVKFEAGF